MWVTADILINSSSLFGVYLVYIFSVGFPGEVWPHLYLCRSSSLPPLNFQLLFVKSKSKIKTLGQTNFAVLYQFKSVLLIVTAHAPF